MVICLERGAHLHIVQLMTLPLSVSCFSKSQIGFSFLVVAYPGSPGKGPLNWCVCVCVCAPMLIFSYRCTVVCLSVGQEHDLYKNSLADQDAVKGVDSREPKEPCKMGFRIAQRKGHI